MLESSKSINLTGQSTVDVTQEDGSTKNVIVTTYNANIQANGTVSYNEHMQSKDVYLANKDAVDADTKAFKDQLYASLI